MVDFPVSDGRDTEVEKPSSPFTLGPITTLTEDSRALWAIKIEELLQPNNQDGRERSLNQAAIEINKLNGTSGTIQAEIRTVVNSAVTKLLADQEFIRVVEILRKPDIAQYILDDPSPALLETARDRILNQATAGKFQDSVVVIRDTLLPKLESSTQYRELLRFGVIDLLRSEDFKGLSELERKSPGVSAVLKTPLVLDQLLLSATKRLPYGLPDEAMRFRPIQDALRSEAFQTTVADKVLDYVRSGNIQKINTLVERYQNLVNIASIMTRPVEADSSLRFGGGSLADLLTERLIFTFGKVLFYAGEPKYEGQTGDRKATAARDKDALLSTAKLCNLVSRINSAARDPNNTNAVKFAVFINEDRPLMALA